MRGFRQFQWKAIGLAGLLFIPGWLKGQEALSLAPVTRTYAITGVNIIQAPGRKVDMGTVVIKDGLIQQVGKSLAIPADAIVIKADSMYVYAGFIDGLSRTGVVKPKEDQNRERPKDPGNPPPDQAGITPQADVRTSLSSSEKSIEEWRAVGFTAAHVVPYGGMLPGNGAIVLLGGNRTEDMVLAGRSSFYSELTPAQRVSPATVMGVMARYRDLYRNAVLNRNYETLYASNRAGLQRPVADRILESFYPVIDKKQPVLFKAEKVVDAQRVLTLQKDLGFSLMLAELKEGWDITGKVKASNAKVFLSLDLPEEKKEEKKDDKKADKAKSAVDLEAEALEKRKAEFVGKYTGQASVYSKAGVRFGFSTLSAKPKDVHANLRRMIAAGLSEDAALAALTTAPAELLGLSDRLGSVDNGKIANLVISDKPYFDEKAKIRYVFVDGTPYKMEVKESKPADPNAKVEISGTWSITTDTPQGKSDGSVTFKKEGSGYSGTITSSRLPQPATLEVIELDGNKLHFTYKVSFGGNSMTVEVDVTLEGDSFSGTTSLGQFGSFPTEGKKDDPKTN
jgi:hypothetical protein